MTGFGIMSALLSILALLGSSPFWARIYMHYRYSPDIELSLPPNDEGNQREWNDLYNEEVSPIISVNNQTAKTFSLHLEFYAEHASDIIDDRKVIDFGLSERGFRVVTEEFKLGSNNLRTTPFPLAPHSFPCEIEVDVVPKVNLSEFGFPPFFGSVELQPRRFKYTIVNDVESDGNK